MRHKLTENLGLKLIAIFFAMLLWLVVVNVDDPVDSMIYRSVPVTVKNEEVVTNKGKTYQINDNTQLVSVTVNAKRSVLSKITASDIIATADMSEMELSSLVPISVAVQGYEGKYVSATSSPHNLQVTIEDTTKNSFPLTVSTTGTLRDGYVLGDMKTNPESITIGGSESLVKQIDKAVAKVDVSGLGKDSTLKAELILYDAEGNVLDQTLLNNNLDEEGVTVNVQVLNTKKLTIAASVSGTPAEGYVYTGLTCEPETVQVAGTQEDLAELDTLTINPDEINLDGLSGKQQFVIDISKYLPEELELVDKTANNVIATVMVEAAEAKTIELPVESIKVTNLTDGLKSQFETMDDLTLEFTGSQDVLDTLNIKNAAFINLKSYTTAGTYEVPVEVETPTGVTINGTPTVKVTLTKK
ncbi:CdaR family protein [Hespellia stercorisuis]|uniref:YbbR domain-containing protein n=1 Tax=Hespellia stercorisuis DSM 15480 TaxID=1121950 RepID=A0A1M6TY36_9FIRM|nr:CdaR family protein [Hespellia stercorisuis]SHK61821.1 YbbR domain-containing protein [Hespellia stercorisuis DSM 15480]